jgi:ABC-type Fe3+-hydroxamate transport system substrate-binding protein
MRFFLLLGLLALGTSACAHTPASQASATSSAQKAVQDLNGESPLPYAGTLEMTRIYKTTSAATVSDSAGDVLTVNPAPASAWVVEFSAPSDGFWKSVSALVVVDADTGDVSGSGLWKIPVGQPTK